MHVYFIKRPGRDEWERASLVVACLVSKGLARAPHIYDGWAVKTVFVRDLAEHLEPQVVS